MEMIQYFHLKLKEMMRYIFFLFILVCWTNNLFAQVQFSITIKSVQTHLILHQVPIQIFVNHQQYFKGNYEELSQKIFRIPSPDVRFVVDIPQYEKLDTLINLQSAFFQKYIHNQEPIPLFFHLRFDGVTFDDVNINNRYNPPVKFASNRVSVSDYVVLHPDTLLLLTYPQRLEKYSELVWWVDGRIVKIIDAPKDALSLLTDYRGNIYLQAKNQDYKVETDGQLSLKKIDSKELETFIKPILDTFRNQSMFYTTVTDYFPAFDYYRINLKDTTQDVLHHIVDDVMMEQYRSEFKWTDVRTKLWAWEMESKTGIDRRVWVGANVFIHSIYWEPPYGNLFLQYDTVYIFDFYRNKEYKFDAKTGDTLDSLMISFHKNSHKTGWERKMLQDPVTKKIYTLYNEGGYVNVVEINPKTGKKKKDFTLFYRYPHKIQIFNQQVFYIYRPYESPQKKWLYVEGFNDPKRSLKAQNRFSTRNTIKK